MPSVHSDSKVVSRLGNLLKSVGEACIVWDPTERISANKALADLRRVADAIHPDKDVKDVQHVRLKLQKSRASASDASPNVKAIQLLQSELQNALHTLTETSKRAPASKQLFVACQELLREVPLTIRVLIGMHRGVASGQCETPPLSVTSNPIPLASPLCRASHCIPPWQ